MCSLLKVYVQNHLSPKTKKKYIFIGSVCFKVMSKEKYWWQNKTVFWDSQKAIKRKKRYLCYLTKSYLPFKNLNLRFLSIRATVDNLKRTTLPALSKAHRILYHYGALCIEKERHPMVGSTVFHNHNYLFYLRKRL